VFSEFLSQNYFEPENMEKNVVFNGIFLELFKNSFQFNNGEQTEVHTCVLEGRGTGPGNVEFQVPDSPVPFSFLFNF
jgi:hypothetical protein